MTTVKTPAAVSSPASSAERITGSPVRFAPRARVAKARSSVAKAPVDFDLDLNASDDPDAGFVYVEPAPMAVIEGSEVLPPVP